ncbi:T-cell surface antigen CD2 [Engraulis encrasicolus]|uniref:T-cell surface antigen CD2 n=1 Tax=Engraulis encrasicolus TaxID=184585 RepID=UPI002FCE937D
MYGIIGGGGFLLLVLIILLIVLSCKSHRRRKRRQRDLEEMRLQNMQYIGSMPRRPKHSALGQPVPPTPDEQGYLNAPEPGDPGFGNGTGGPGGTEFDRGSGVVMLPVEPQTQTQTQTRRQARPRAPPPPTEEEEEAPPLPQPRRTGHHRPRP